MHKRSRQHVCACIVAICNKMRIGALLSRLLWPTLLLLSMSATATSQATTCVTGDVRLAGLSTRRNGRVEICFNNRWGTICDDSWDDRDAQVVCRQLGYSALGARGYSGTIAEYDPGIGPIHLDNVDCQGTEEYLFNCSASPVGDHDCSHIEDAGVLCEEPGFSCEDGEVRLLDGQSMYEGRVEVCLNNKFSTICQNRWGNEEASVVCRQLGFTQGGTPYATSGGTFGTGVGAISWTGLNCNGSESNLTECGTIPSLLDAFCSHRNDVGVLCPRPNSSCAEGEIRLSGGRTNAEGYVEICLNGHWGTVCHSGWDSDDANVACGELGFTRNGSIPIRFGDFGTGDGLVLLSDIACTGTESNLNLCPRAVLTDHFCTHSQDAGVICVDLNNTCADGEMRLVDGQSSNEGRLEICYSNHWGTVCDDDFDHVEAALVCRKLGFEDEGAFSLHGAHFGAGVGLIFLDDLECVGNESTLFNCSHLGVGNSNCFHNEDVSVLCQASNSSCINGEIRLVNGSGAHSGRVEVCFNGRFGTVCDDNWGADDATVVCNQLGYTGEGAIGLSGAFYGQGTGAIFLDNTDCNPANHSTLLSCFDTENEVGVHNCDHSEDAAVICPLGNRTCNGSLNGAVRLVGGSSALEGRVELCLDGEWGTICDNFWSDRDAAVVCTQLTHGPTDAQSLKGAFFGPGTGSIHLDRFFCLGSETRITDCLHFPAIPGNCDHNQDVGVVCSAESCTEGEVRLVNGKIPSEGRVEICINGQFGTVCDDEWDSLDATVVCRQLGYNDGLGAVSLPLAFFGQGSNQIFLDDVRCLGNETRLLDCAYQRDPFFCFHFEDAGVVCQSANASHNCSNGDIRLVGGGAPHEGNVEVCFNGNWGTVCHDRWDTADARTVCRILGYRSEYALPTRLAHFGRGEGIIFLDEVDCIGNETNILQCLSKNPGNHDCSHFMDAGVICSVSNSTFTCQTGQIRLINGASNNSHEGRVEVCFNGVWGTVCDDSWGDNDAAVVCNSLGFGAEGAQGLGQAPYGQGEGPILMANLVCTGNESNLFECGLQGPGFFCSHREDAGVICKQPPCYDGDIRLVNGQVASEGNIEVCIDREWSGTVCDFQWDNADAAVVCRQLGYSSEASVATRGAFFGLGLNQAVLTDVECLGTESSLSECQSSQNTFFCFPTFDTAGVICATNESTNCTTGEVRLAGGRSQYEGRVELCLHGRWGTICDDSWDSRDSAVVCRQLGYTPGAGNNISGVALAVNRAAFGPGEGFIILDEVNCNGTETALLECRARELGLHNCRPSEDASVYCPYPALPNKCANGDVRLVDGATPDRGRVEYCVGGVWNTICGDNYWSNEDAQTVCRQLGFQSPENAVAIVAGGGSGPIQIIHFSCSGTEQRISDCPVPDFAFISLECTSHNNDAGVVCSPVADNSTCADGDLRLVDGAVSNEGRVEVCFNNEWGTVCDDRFGKEEAMVICRQLNFTESIEDSVPIGRAFFGRGFVPIHLDELRCRGNESSLIECGHSGVSVHNCVHSEDAGVICIAPNPVCTHGDLRLVNGDTEYEGRLEVCLGGRWGTVCNDFWDNSDASVVCRQLGYSDQGAIATDVVQFGVGTGLIFLDDLQCAGTEQRLLDCPSADAGTHNCVHSEDVGVICQALLSCTTGAVRLVGGAERTEGTVEVCVDGVWGTVCSDGWDNTDATVVCNSLGFTGNDSFAVLYSFFGVGSGNVSLTNVRCLGTESSIQSCNYTSSNSCSHQSDAGVICPPETPRNCTSGDVQLAGRRPYKGYVEVCLHGYWITVCSGSQWGINEANVVCGQLGYTQNGGPIPVIGYPEFSFSSIRDLAISVTCTGNEANLFQCRAGEAQQRRCASFTAAGVICPTLSSSCSNGDIRLTNLRGPDSGQLELCVDGLWQSMCVDFFFSSWTDNNAKAACRQLGYAESDARGAVAINVFDDYSYYNPFGVTYPYDFFCNGNESSLFECSQVQGFSFHFGGACIFGEHAGVICKAANDSCTEGEIRLVGGSAENEGRVEICLNSRWGTVCDDSWGTEEAQVVCNQLGFQNYEDSIAFGNAFFGQGIVPVHLDELQCSGNESSLSECRHSGVGVHNCGHHEDAGVFCIPANATNCTTGELRLVAGRADNEGRVEVCVGGVWGTVCDDQFDQRDARVICRQLGFSTDSVTALGRAFFGQGTGLILLDNLDCHGNETRLFDCIHSGTGNHNCGHSEDASVQCLEPLPTGTTAVTNPSTTPPTTPTTTPPTTAVSECTEESVELRDGSSSNEGTVYLCQGGEWGTVCDDTWDSADARVVCAQLGFGSGDPISVRGAFFGQGQGPIHIIQALCTGGEQSLADCPSSPGFFPCSHFEDAGVICPPRQPTNCTTGAVRLAGGRSQYEGRVELCLHGRWGTICDDSWDSREAAVVCTQLGYTQNGLPWVALGARFGAGEGLIILDEVNCMGTETSLLGCRASQYGQHNCLPIEDAGVYCPYAGSTCKNGDVRLVGGENSFEGRPEVCIGGEWGTFCSDFYWDDRDARAICRTLGYSDVSSALALSNGRYGIGSGPIHMGTLNCTGNETNILQCQTISGPGFSCTHANDAGVQCQRRNDTLCEEGNIRLVGGVTRNEGRVEICFDNHWGTICDDNWGPNEAAVVCRQLGFGDGEGSIAIGRAYFGQGTGRIYLDEVNCAKTEAVITDCGHDGVNTHNCGHSEDAGVICIVDNPACTYGEIRVVGGSSRLEGRVEICIGGRWGTVCDDLWDETDASVVCGQLGFSQTNSIHRTSAFFGQGTGPIFIDQTQCTGNESRLIDCTNSGVAVHNCRHSEDAGVTCEPLPCSDDTFRLIGGTESIGMPQVCVNRQWGFICGDLFSSQTAALVCDRLGLDTARSLPVSPSLFRLENTEVTNTFNLSVECSNGACTFSPSLNTNCATSEVPAVLCPSILNATSPEVCRTGDIRLAGGSGLFEGRVEVCLNNEWGTVCDDSWDDRAAAVICRQLGQPTEGAYAEREGKYGPGVGAIHLDDVKCRGTESHILECSQLPLSAVHNCDHTEDATVVCPGGVPPTKSTPSIKTNTPPPVTTAKAGPSISVGGLSGNNIISVVVPLVLIIILLIIIIVMIVVIFLVYKARKSGKLTFRAFEDERPIVSSESFSAEVSGKEDIAMTEKTDQL